MSTIILQEEVSNPSTPGTGKWRVFTKSDGLYIIDDVGNVTGPFGTGTGTGGGGDTVRTKYRITPSVLSNNLTVAIKYLDGNDCTATNKLTFRVGITEYELTTSASITKNAGTNWCNAGGTELATKAIDYFVYAIGETGASAGLKFGFSRIPYARTMADFVNTTTSEKYIAGNWTNFTSTDYVTLIGRFRATLSAGAGYTWSIATQVVVDRPIFQTDWLDWQPVYDANYTSVTTTIARYRVDYRKCEVTWRTLGTSANSVTGHTVTLPFEVSNSANNPLLGALLWSDPGASGFGGAYLLAGTPDYANCVKYNIAAYANGAVATVLNGFYEIE